jgi:hypothetical protein
VRHSCSSALGSLFHCPLYIYLGYVGKLFQDIELYMETNNSVFIYHIHIHVKPHLSRARLLACVVRTTVLHMIWAGPEGRSLREVLQVVLGSRPVCRLQ